MGLTQKKKLTFAELNSLFIWPEGSEEFLERMLSVTNTLFLMPGAPLLDCWAAGL